MRGLIELPNFELVLRASSFWLLSVALIGLWNGLMHGKQFDKKFRAYSKRLSFVITFAVPFILVNILRIAGSVGIALFLARTLGHGWTEIVYILVYCLILVLAMWLSLVAVYLIEWPVGNLMRQRDGSISKPFDWKRVQWSRQKKPRRRRENG